MKHNPRRWVGLRQSSFNGDPNDKRTCLPTGRMAQCRMQIEKCKIAFCQIGTLARLHVRTLARLHVRTMRRA